MSDRRYSEGDLDRIFSSGSIKQKARLYIRDRMGYFGQGFILSPSEAEQLPRSFEPWKRDEWEKYVSFALRLENGFKDMNRSLERIIRNRDDLLRTLFEIHDFEQLELLLNLFVDPDLDPVLWDDIGEPDSLLPRLALDNLRKRFIQDNSFRLIDPGIDSSNHIDLHLSGDGSLRERAGKLRDRLRKEMRFYLCYEVAIRQRIPELGLSVPEYENLLKKNREVVEEPVSMSLRWAGVQDNRTYQLGETNLKDRNPQEYPFPSLMRMIEDYSVRPQDIDLNSPESKKEIKISYEQI